MKKLKAFISICLVVIYVVIQRIFYPIMTNEVALNQFEDTANSFVDITTSQLVLHNLHWIFLVLILIVYYKEIINIIKKVKF